MFRILELFKYTFSSSKNLTLSLELYLITHPLAIYALFSALPLNSQRKYAILRTNRTSALFLFRIHLQTTILYEPKD